MLSRSARAAAAGAPRLARRVQSTLAMANDLARLHRDLDDGASARAVGLAPGKRTLSQGLPATRATGTTPPPSAVTPVQLAQLARLPDPFAFSDVAVQCDGGDVAAGVDVASAAQAGVSGPAVGLPHGDAIQRAFGPDHDLSGIQAHVGGAAAAAAVELGAAGFAVGEHVAFRAAPSLRLAAHEAAHVVQQRAGVHLSGGVGQAGDVYEQHADAVADRVVAGQSAAELLGPARGGASVVQRAPEEGPPRGDQCDGRGLRIGDGHVVTDWATAVGTINTLYTGVSTGVGWKKYRGVERWYKEAGQDDPPPVWQDILINAVGFAAAAGVAGWGAVLTARIVTNAASTALRAAVAAGIDVGKNVAKSVASAAVAKAMHGGSSDGRIVYSEALEDDIDKSTAAESRALAGGLSGLATADDATRWPALQALFDGITATADEATAIQHGATVEGWMSAAAQREHGADFAIGGQTLAGLFRAGRLTMGQAQSIRAHLQVSRDPSDLTRLPAEHQAALAGALGPRWASMPVERRTSTEALSVSGLAWWSKTTTRGVLEIFLDTPLDGDVAGEPTVDYVELESDEGLNDATRAYVLGSDKRVEEFEVPKLLVGDGFRIAFDEANGATIRTGLTGGHSEWLDRYGARKLGVRYDPADRAVYATAALAFLRQELLGRTLRQLNVRAIGR